MAFIDTIRNFFAVGQTPDPDVNEYGVTLLPSPSITTAPVPEPPGPERGVPPPKTVALGASGTPIFGGFVRDLGEYNPKLEGRNAFPTYEKMRRSDADVAAALLACKLPIRAAECQIVPGLEESDPGYALAKEIAEFVRGNLFGGLESPTENGLPVTQSFESVLENALLCLDFGCAGHEDLWHVDGDRVRLRRLAPRLPLTYFRFHVEEDGETLKALEQWGFRGNNFVNVQVPVDKLSLFVVNREGANFFGRSILRPAYQHWYMKSQLYRIDAIGIERNALGVPWIEQGANATPADIKTANTWVTKMTTHENLGISLPPGWRLHLQGIEGRLREPIESMKHHSEMIVRSVLAMFMGLGTSQTGSRALGSVMTDFFYLSLESIARLIADTLTHTTIRRLVSYNYSPDGAESAAPLPYPRLVISNIAALNPLETIGVIKDAATANVDLIQPDNDTENYFRKKLGLPLKAKSPRPRFAPIVQRIQENQAAAPIAEEQGSRTGAEET